MNGYSNQEKLTKGYDRMVHAILPEIYKKYPAKLVSTIVADTRWEFSRLIPHIPYIGENNVWQFNLDTAAIDLALYQSLKKQGFSLPEIVQITYDLFESYLLSFSLPLRMAYQLYFFSVWNLNKLRWGAQVSQSRQHPEDWVFSYVEGNSVFDAGVDISECAILKFFHAHGADEFAPNLCALDHLMGKVLNLGFSRSSTLAGGASVCDCRWKRGAQTNGWPVSRLVSHPAIYQ